MLDSPSVLSFQVSQSFRVALLLSQFPSYLRSSSLLLCKVFVLLKVYNILNKANEVFV